MTETGYQVNGVGVSIPSDAKIDPFVYLGREPTLAGFRRVISLGQRIMIGSHAVIYFDVDLGIDCILGEGCVIREGCRIGNNVMIGPNVSLGPNVVIQDNTAIHAGSRIAGNTRIGRNCYIGSNVTISNVRRIDLSSYDHRSDDESLGPQIGDMVMIGGGANILSGVTIGDRAVVAAGSIVADPVPAGAVMMGKKARRLAQASQP